MAKGGKLGKLKGMIKRWNSCSGKTHHHSIGNGTLSPTSSSSWQEDPAAGAPISLDAPSAEKVPPGTHPVYVGKSRRRYLIASHLVHHPLFQVFVQRSGGRVSVGEGEDGEEEDSTVVSGCEVVLFEHLLWMLENADDPQPDSLDEIIDFYAC